MTEFEDSCELFSEKEEEERGSQISDSQVKQNSLLPGHTGGQTGCVSDGVC